MTETVKHVNKIGEKRAEEAKSSRFSFTLSLNCTLMYIHYCATTQTVALCTKTAVLRTNIQTSLFTPFLSKCFYDFKAIVRGITYNT